MQPLTDSAALDHAIAELVAGNPNQLSAREYRAVADAILSQKGAHVLIFGTGRDSDLWMRVNAQGGRTAFLESNPKWLAEAQNACPGLEAHLVEYHTKRGEWREWLGKSPEPLLLHLPETVANTPWDVILVDGPAAYSDTITAGRMQSIYTAARLAKPGAQIFVHDCEREVESAYCDRFLAPIANLVAEFDRMRHYQTHGVLSKTSLEHSTMTPAAIPHFLHGSTTIPAQAGEPIEVTSPLDGSSLGQVIPADHAATDAAVKQAQEAFKTWSTVPVKDRVQPLYRFKQAVETNIRELSDLVSKENGKTPDEAEAGIRKGLEVVEYAASLPALLTGQTLEVSRGVDCYTRRYPLGVGVGITPFNFPAMVPMWMFPIAIATGNTFILKPSEQVPLTPLRLAELFAESGLPPGVFSVLQGNRVTVEALLDHPGVAAAAFVGSTKIAKQVYERGIAKNKRVLALGGAKNHLVVVPDADPEITAKNVVSSAVGCAGQRCMAASVLITVGNCDHVLKAVEAEMRAFVPGKNLGAIISGVAKERIEGYIGRAEAGGAKILVDGRGAKVAGKDGGYYVGPTLIEGIEPSHECACDEIFGPVLTILHVDTLDEALVIENENPYGNAASIYTSSGATARYFEDRASAGMIGVNIGVPVPREPFSFGGWNDSKFGNGDITGEDGVRFWTQTKKITQKWTAHASRNWMS